MVVPSSSLQWIGDGLEAAREMSQHLPLGARQAPAESAVAQVLPLPAQMGTGKAFAAREPTSSKPGKQTWSFSCILQR